MVGGMARKAVAPAMLALVAAIGLLSRGVAPATATTCPMTTTPAVGLTLDQFDQSIFCLINESRILQGRPSLRPNPLLHGAAWKYANSMLVGRFFSHYGDFAGHSSGSTVIGRLREIGYIRGGYVWHVGENLRWSTGETSTTGDVVAAWMNSPIHRKYLLNPRFRELGVAAVSGTPIDPEDADGVIVASEFGFRRQ
jgi:uncharacterized protein YkwD